MSEFSPVQTKTLIELIREVERAETRSKKAMERRMAFGPGDSKKRKGSWTTANARWSSAAEHRDKCNERLVDAMKNAILFGVETGTR